MPQIEIDLELQEQRPAAGTGYQKIATSTTTADIVLSKTTSEGNITQETNTDEIASLFEVRSSW
jgi:hypothetical protein